MVSKCIRCDTTIRGIRQFHSRFCKKCWEDVKKLKNWARKNGY